MGPPRNDYNALGCDMHIDFFFNNLHTVCFIHGLSIYEIKRICHRTHFFIISYGRFQFLANFLDITQVFNVKIK